MTGAAEDRKVVIFTDGSCRGNPGPGGWAAILKFGERVKELAGGEPLTTNNRMELTAVVHGLEALKGPSRVTLYADSQYVGKGLSDWMAKWKANGWRRREGGKLKEVKNEDLWRRLDELVSAHELIYSWVAGHAGHEENERCDRLAVAAYQQFLRK